MWYSVCSLMFTSVLTRGSGEERNAGSRKEPPHAGMNKLDSSLTLLVIVFSNVRKYTAHSDGPGPGVRHPRSKGHFGFFLFLSEVEGIRISGTAPIQVWAKGKLA